MSSLVEFAKRELAILAGDAGENDEQQRWMNEHLVRMVETFTGEGHSGFSASYAISLLTKLLRFQPLTPLFGDDSEWNDITAYGSGGEMEWQNNRCFSVFKRADGTAYDIDAVRFRGPDGVCFTSAESKRDITFPYYPRTEYVDVPASSVNPEAS